MKKINPRIFNLAKVGSGYLIGEIFLRGMVFLTLPIFTRLMSTDSFGKYSVYMSYENIIMLVILLGVSGSIRRAKIDFGSDKLNSYISSMVSIAIISFAGMLLIYTLVYLFGIDIFGFGFIFGSLLLMHSLMSGIVKIYFIKFSIMYAYKKYLLISFIISFSNLVISFFLIKFLFNEATFKGRIIGTALPVVLAGGLMLVIIYRNGKVFYDNFYWRYALAISLPLMIHSLSLLVLSQFDRIMISKIVGDSEAGIYSLMYSFGMLLGLVWGALDNVWTQWVFDSLNNNNQISIRKIAEKYITIILTLVICATLVLPEIIKIMVDEKFYKGIELVVPISAAAYLGFLYTFFVQIENFYKKTIFVAIGTSLAGILNIILNLIFIPKFGYVAAAFTTLISYFSLLVYHSLITTFVLKIVVYRLWYILTHGLVVIIYSFSMIPFKISLVTRFSMAACILISIAFYLYRIIQPKKKLY